MTDGLRSSSLVDEIKAPLTMYYLCLVDTLVGLRLRAYCHSWLRNGTIW